MHRIVPVTVATLALLFTGRAQAACSDPDLDTVRDRVLAACSCDNNHGQYVSCVVGEIRKAVASGELDVNCKGKVTRCAARSTCGHKAEFRTCTLCDPGVCTEGLCQDGTTACVDASDCPGVVRRCSKKSSEDKCVVPPSLEGTGVTAVPSTGSCCQASCPIPE